MKHRISTLFTAIAVLVPAVAGAQSYTPDLGAFWRTCPAGQQCIAEDLDGFDDFAAQIGSALAPRMIGPADTLGSRRFEVALITGILGLDTTRTYWTSDPADGRPGVARDPGSLLTTTHVRVRKGLPYSFQVGGQVSHLYQSDLWGISAEIGWALVEGFRSAPDILLTAGIGTLLGTRDMLMIQVSPAVIVSKRFGVAGLFSLAPSVGYNLLYLNSSTHLTSTWRPGAVEPIRFAIDPRHIVLHRVAIGLEALASWISIGAELVVEAPSARLSGAFKLGAVF
jgi:hypothetical protein